MNHRTLILPLFALLASAAGAQAHDGAVHVGTRVRLFVVDTVNAATGELRVSSPVGTVTRLDDQSLILHPDGASSNQAADEKVPVMHIGSAEAFNGSHRNSLVGGATGAVVGTVVGLVFGNPGGARRVCTPYGCADGTVKSTLTKYAVAGGGIGLFAGALVGYWVRTERWSTVDGRRGRVAAAGRNSVDDVVGSRPRETRWRRVRRRILLIWPRLTRLSRAPAPILPLPHAHLTTCPDPASLPRSPAA